VPGRAKKRQCTSNILQKRLNRRNSRIDLNPRNCLGLPRCGGYKFIAKTPEAETIAAATQTGSGDDGSRVYIIPQSIINGYREKPSAPLAILNPNADPLDNIAASFRKLPASRNAEIVTTPVRFHLDTDLFKAFEYDQVQEYKAQLIAEGRWRLPNDGGRYTIRFNYWDVPEVFGFTAEMRSNWNGPNDGAAAKAGIGEFFVDFDMNGETMTRATDVVRSHLPGLSFEQKKLTIENSARVRDQDVAGYDYNKATAWWEANGWLVHRCDYEAGFELHAPQRRPGYHRSAGALEEVEGERPRASRAGRARDHDLLPGPRDRRRWSLGRTQARVCTGGAATAAP
jgi:hypothetical protein